MLSRFCAVLTLVAALAAAGCGGSDDEDASPQADRQEGSAEGAPAGTSEEEKSGGAESGGKPGGGDDAGGDSDAKRGGDASPRDGGARSRDGDEEDSSGGSRRRRSSSDRTRSRPEARGPRVLTHSQVVTVADGTCSEARRRQRAIDEGGGDSYARLARRAAGLREVTEWALGRFRAIRAPSERRDVFNAYVDAIAAQVPALRDLQSAAERKDRNGTRETLARIERLGATAREHARSYGFQICGSG